MNHIKNFASIIILVLVMSSCGQKHNLTVKIEGLGNDTILIEYEPVSTLYKGELLTDTIICVNDKFVFDLPVKEPIIAYFLPKKGGFKRLDGSTYFAVHKCIDVLLKPNDNLFIQGKMHEYYIDYEIEGSEFNEEFSKLRKEYIQQTSEAVKVELQLDTLMSNKGDKDEISRLFKKRNKINGIGTTKKLEYFKNNLDKELSAYFLAIQWIDTVAKYQTQLNVEVRNGIFKSAIDYKLIQHEKYKRVKEAEKTIIEGNIAPNFSLQSSKGGSFSLSSIKDKYVVLDFWGSWCGWCIKGFPKMKEYYDKYKDKMEIVGVACGDTEANWKKSIEDNKLNWINVINDDNIDKDVSLIYGIRAYPTKIILDKNKKILGKFDGESDDFYKKLDELIEN